MQKQIHLRKESDNLDGYLSLSLSLLPINVTGIPLSRAEMAVHFPVPFCPAESRIFSTRGDPSVSCDRSNIKSCDIIAKAFGCHSVTNEVENWIKIGSN